jgi:hypothetical protein
MVVSIQSAMVSQFCVRSTLEEVNFENNPSAHFSFDAM